MCEICGKNEEEVDGLCSTCDGAYWGAVNDQDDAWREDFKEQFPCATAKEIEDMVDRANCGIFPN